MVDPHDVLLDDRALVEVARDEVRRRTDQLHAPLVGLPVRVRALEARQERVVDVDDAALERGAQLGGEDLHVAGEHDEFDVVLLDRAQHALLERRLLLGGRHRTRLEGDVVEARELGEVGVVAEHERDLHRQLPAALTEQQVVEAVCRLRDEHERAQGATDAVDAALHAVVLDDRLQCVEQAPVIGRRLGLQAQEEAAALEPRELLQLGDVALRFDDRACHGMHDAGPVVADDGHDPVVKGACHALQPIRRRVRARSHRRERRRPRPLRRLRPRRSARRTRR